MHIYFGPEGILAAKVQGFEHRASQQRMAEAVAQCLGLEIPLLVEAGTGTGKTWAYLIPAILSGKRVVVSTGTKALQEQIQDHDIPFLKRLLHPQLKAVCLKGRRNYLCRRRFREFAYQPTFWNQDEARLFRQLQTWAVRSPAGDRAEVEWLPDHFQAWNEISCDSDACLGQQCDDFSRCFLTRVRQEAAQAHLVIVNHHLFFADLSLRSRGLGEVLPDHDAVVFDEAHQLEDTVGLYFGFVLSSLRLKDLVSDILRECGRASHGGKGQYQELRKTAESLDPLGRLLHHDLRRMDRPGRFPLDLDALGEDFVKHLHRLFQSLQRLEELVTPHGESPPSFESLARRTSELKKAAENFAKPDDPSFVHWCEVSPKVFFMHGTPVAVDHIVGEELLKRNSALVFTSATLAVAGSFDFFKRGLGLPLHCREELLPSPFDYENQALLYVPSAFPAPQERNFCSALAEQALEILKMTRGRALLLFTSYRNMREVHALLRDRLPFPLLMQGEKPKRALIAQFKKSVDSVLLATSSFWQGIDVPGEALSCLMIDKLPFEVPEDPVIAARMQYVTDQGKSSFFHYQVPRAVIQLKQGVGRLIRCSTDGGLIAIFDVRLRTRGYGSLFFKSLPPFPLTQRLDEVEAFLVGRCCARESHPKLP